VNANFSPFHSITRRNGLPELDLALVDAISRRASTCAGAIREFHCSD
jgi:hypothetical protein